MEKIFLLSFVLLSFIIPVNAQLDVVINELDLNPSGDDANSISDWIELYNPTDSSVNIGDWKIKSLNNTFSIPHNTVIESGEFLTFSHVSGWFADLNETVTLYDNHDGIIDTTPLISDLQDSSLSWQRISDGYDLDSVNDWKFAISTPGSSNGQSETSGVVISADKETYFFGEIAHITGSVSDTGAVSTEPIILSITGPDYNKTETLYPDFNKNYETRISLQPVLGINEGSYTVSSSYSGATDQVMFVVMPPPNNNNPISTGILTITTDNSEYIPGQTVQINATTDKIVQSAGLKFEIIDPSDEIIASGNLFPINGEFSTSVFLSTINPTYGTYEIVGRYHNQSSIITFELVQDIKEDKLISLGTDKEVYEPGELVTITGRLNQQWVGSLDLEILQTKNIALHTQDAGGRVLKILDSISPKGDGKFEYTFTIPDSNDRLGDYWIKVSESIGSATTTFVVTENPDEYIMDDRPITLFADKSTYDLGDTMMVTGKIANVVYSTSGTTQAKLVIYSDDGSPVEISGSPRGFGTQYVDGERVGVEYTTIPDPSGRISFEIFLPQNTFSAGNYILEVSYRDISESIMVELVDTFVAHEAFVSIDKDVYGFNETVFLSGMLPVRAENAVSISLTKPDGTIINSGSAANNRMFDWQWQTPASAGYQPLKGTTDRSIFASNLGVYKIIVSSGTFSQVILFKVSDDPENDELPTELLVVNPEKPNYTVGEKLKVVGSVIARESDIDGLVIPDRVRITVFSSTPPRQIHEAFVYPNQGGYFESLFELPLTLFKEGEHKIRANYSNISAESTFTITNNYSSETGDSVVLLLSTDKPSYQPGDVVTVSGGPSRIIHIEHFDVSVSKQSDIICDSVICGIHSGPVTRIEPSSLNSFVHTFTLDDSPSSIGTYEVTVNAGFEANSVTFVVENEDTTKPTDESVDTVIVEPIDTTEEPMDTIVVEPIDTTENESADTPIIVEPIDESVDSEPIVSTVIEKFNRIPDSHIEILTSTKSDEDSIMHPRVLSGSLGTLPSDIADVNLMVTSESGICIIGQNAECLVRDSTRKPGSIFDAVEIDGVTFNVRYSGPDVRLEKFNIVPVTTEYLPTTTWSIDILKDDQPSRFYYKINYKMIH